MVNILKINGQDEGDTINVPFYFNASNYYTCTTDGSTVNILINAGYDSNTNALKITSFQGKNIYTSSNIAALDSAIARNSQELGNIVDVEEVMGYERTNASTPRVSSIGYPIAE
jgi:hypothetical protein